MLTVSGYGGTGKTRFAIELYRRVSADYPGGAAFVSLASVTSAAEVIPTIVVSLDIGAGSAKERGSQRLGSSSQSTMLMPDSPRMPRARPTLRRRSDARRHFTAPVGFRMTHVQTE